MRSIMLGFLSFWCFTSFAQDDTLIAALEAQALAHAKTYAPEVQQMLHTIHLPKYSAELTQLAKAAQPKESIAEHLQKVSQVLVFLSFSMPEKSLQGWLMQCKQSGATPVIRGLINNSFKDTFQTIRALSEKTGIGVQLDPILFKTFNITQVPSVVWVESHDICSDTMNCLPVSFDLIAGDVSLDYALEKMKGTTNPMVERLRGAL